MSPAPKRPFRYSRPAGIFTTDLRYRFLRAVDEVAPELAAQMVQAIGPVFKRLAERVTEVDLPSFPCIARQQEEFLTAWRKWGQPYGLNQDSWIMDHALSCLPAFLSDPDMPPSFARAPVLMAYPRPGLEFTLPGPYYPDLETRAEYDKRVSEYADSVEKIARATGWEPAPAKPRAQPHLRWLARFQVKGETVAAIVRSEREKGMEATLAELARIRLELRANVERLQDLRGVARDQRAIDAILTSADAHGFDSPAPTLVHHDAERLLGWRLLLTRRQR